MGHTACTEPHFLYSTAILLLPLLAIRPVLSLSAWTVHLYFYSLYWPYSLYRTSVPVKYIYTSTPPINHTACTDPRCLNSTAIILLHVLVIRPLQSHSAVQYIYNSTPPIDLTARTEPQCHFSRAIPLLPLLAIRPLYSLSACTLKLYFYSPYCPYVLYRVSMPVQYSYTSTPPIDHTASTESQCLYHTAISLLPLWAIQTSHRLSTCTVWLYLYSHYVPYSLYRASVPVQYSYTSTPRMGHMAWTETKFLYSISIPLLPLLTIRPIQCLSVCTIQIYLYSPY
jgi:hypothetical protein